MINWSSLIKLGIAIAIPLVGGFIVGQSTRGQVNTWYKTINRPSWSPPNWAFPVAWTTLYICMGVASYLVYRDGDGFRGVARWPLILYLGQLVLNFLWTPIFFTYHEIGLALTDIIALDVLVACCIVVFAPINQLAAALMLPYLCWIGYATALMVYIYKNNNPGPTD